MAQQGDKIRIAMLTTELALGGAERCLVNLAVGLDRKRFEPEVYSLASSPRASRDQLVRRLKAAGVAVHFIGLRSRLDLFKAIRQLRNLFQQQSPDVLQSFLFHANILGAWAGRQAGVGTIVTGIRVADPRRWRWHTERHLTRQVTKIVCVSQSVAEFYRTKAGLPAEKMVVIPNGVDLSDFPGRPAVDLTEVGVPAGSQVVVAVGRLDRQKGTDWLVQLWPKLLHQCPTSHLLLVGDGPLRSQLERQSRALGISRQVHFAGWRPDVARILPSCNLFVLPSRWEGMPNVLMEAMACGMPVVSTRVEGVAEVLGPLAQEQTAAFGDFKAFVGAMVRIIADCKLAQSLGRSNRARIEQAFTCHSVISAYQRLYESLV